MLTVTASASEAIRQLVDNSGADEAAGIRIAAGEPTEKGTPLSLAITDGPEPGDEVVSGDGSVFLEPAVAQALGDTVLDAEVNDGEIAFALVNPADTPSSNGSEPQ